MPVTFTTPVGRLVQGSCFEMSEKDQQGNPRVIKTGPNAGQPAPQAFVAVAFPKLVNGAPNPDFAQFFALLLQEARAGFPHLFDAQGRCLNPQFAWKVVDGDGMDQQGRPNSAKEGFAGHWVVRFSSGFLPRCFHAGRYSPHEQIQDPLAIRRGYFVRVNGTVQANNNAQRPGLYLNLAMVELAGYGPEIISGPSAQDAFGGNAPVLPPGASATPLAPPAGVPAGAAPTPNAMPAGVPAGYPGVPAATAAPAGSPPAGFPAQTPGTVPTAAPAHVAAPANPPAAYAGYMQPPAVPTPAVPSAPVPAAPAALVMTPAAGGATLEQFLAQGWTEDLLIAQGFAVRAA